MPDNGSNPELPMVQLPTAHPCAECGQCCTYVAVEIDNPSGFDDYDHIYWYLTHRGICVYVDWEGDWFVEMETVCEHLSEARTCGIYEDRPKMCSDFSWQECEKTTNERAWKVRFDQPADLLEFMREKRPRNYERYMKAREKLLAKRRAAEAASPPKGKAEDPSAEARPSA
jgi:Fe-S-cluster containining protein